MKFKIWSDLHTEFYCHTPDDKFKRIFKQYFPLEEDDKNTILLLSGDVGTYYNYDSTYRRVFNMLSKRFKKVICVPGNHSWYKSSIWDTEFYFWKEKSLPKKVHYLDNDSVMIDKNTIVIGSCLWTDFNKENPVTMSQVESRMNDYNLIKHGIASDDGIYQYPYKKNIRPEDTLKRFKFSKNYIISTLKEATEKGIKNKILVTHHAPSYQSTDPRYAGDSLTPAYCSDLEEIMLEYDVKLWTHGHQHCSNDYTIGNTRVLCNSFGYHNYETNPKFKHNLIVEI